MKLSRKAKFDSQPTGSALGLRNRIVFGLCTPHEILSVPVAAQRLGQRLELGRVELIGTGRRLPCDRRRRRL